MATGTKRQGTDGTAAFSEVSRLRGVVFQYVTFAASLFGILSLAVLLGYVFWDAFGLETAAPAWYATMVVTVVLPVAGFLLYARRNPLAGRAALELAATATGGVLSGFALVVVLEVIAGFGVWFAYFLTMGVPLGALYLYGRRVEASWTGLAVLGVLVAGPVVGTVLLDPLSRIGGLLGGPGVYYLSVVAPTALVVRAVGGYLDGLNGNYLALATLVVPILAVPAVDVVAVLSRSVWFLFFAALVVPFSIVAGRNLATPGRRVGVVGPLAFALGVGLLAVVPDLLGVAGPSPWFDWQYVTSPPSQTAERAGLYPAIIGSIFMIVLVALLTLVLGVGAALYLEEYAPSSGPAGVVTQLVRINISNLAGVPSVVYGILGIAVIFPNSPLGGLNFVVATPIMMSGAVSPIARPNASIVPVRMPGMARGMMTFLIVCHRVAPIP